MTRTALQSVTDVQISLNGRTIAVVDDDEIFRSYFTLLLAPLGVNVDAHATGDSLVTTLDRRMPDCIFLDYNIVHENGLFLQQQLRARFPNLAPVLIVSADDSQRTAIRAFRTGVDDFIQKRGLKLDEVESALRRVIGKHEADPLRLAADGRRAQSGAIDHATGLFSKAEFEAKLAAVEELSERAGTTVGLMAIHFSPWSAVAFQFGLVMAEKVLRGFATRLSNSVGPEFLCARYADDVLCCLVERGADAAQMEAGVRAVKAALTYTQNIGAVQVLIEPRGEACARAPGGASLADLTTELSSRFDIERRETVNKLTGLGASSTRLAHSPASELQPYTGIERRRSVRRRLFKRGTVGLNNGSSRLPCTIRNLSDGGACIRLESAMVTPELFTLSLGVGEAPRRVRKRWQTNQDLGVEFLD
jgi:DNA-binding response OmpR family regulator